MDYMELARTLDDLNEWKFQNKEERVQPELDGLNEYLKPYNLCVMLVDSAYNNRYRVVYAIMSLTNMQ